MLGSTTLEVAIGLALVYLLLSLICSAINEAIAGVLAWRAKTLEQGLLTMLGDTHLVAELYAHPLINTQYNRRKPSYISAHTFALTLIDVLRARSKSADPVPTPSAAAPTDAKNPLANVVGALPDTSELSRTLSVLLEDAGTDPQAFKSSIERWFNDTMQRVSGWYKRKAQISLVVISLIVSLAIGVDTLTLATSFWRDPTLRAAAVAAAQQTIKNPHAAAKDSTLTQIPTLQGELTKLDLPAGWTTRPQSFQQWASKIIGLLLTAIALSLGAPFWFALLNKLVNLRSSGPKPADSSSR